MLDSRDQEFQQERESRRELLDQQYLDGLVGDQTYYVSMEILRYKDREIRDHLFRLNSIKAVKKQRMSFEERRLKESHDWIAQYRAAKEAAR